MLAHSGTYAYISGYSDICINSENSILTPVYRKFLSFSEYYIAMISIAIISLRVL